MRYGNRWKRQFKLALNEPTTKFLWNPWFTKNYFSSWQARLYWFSSHKLQGQSTVLLLTKLTVKTFKKRRSASPPESDTTAASEFRAPFLANRLAWIIGGFTLVQRVNNIVRQKKQAGYVLEPVNANSTSLETQLAKLLAKIAQMERIARMAPDQAASIHLAHRQIQILFIHRVNHWHTLAAHHPLLLLIGLLWLPQC